MSAAGLIAGFITVKIFFLLMTINSDSMNPTLKPGDKILISRTAGLKKGDIAAIDSPTEEGRILISRILASEYETVEIRNKVVYINDKKTDIVSETTRDENIIYPMKFCHRDNMPPVRIERNEFFVLGDNFDGGFDSRSFGRISKDAILGKIIYIKKSSL
jgi:signal peptidase I